MSSALIIMISLAFFTFQLPMPCVHVFEEDYAVFLLRDSPSWIKLSNQESRMNTDSGMIMFSCDLFDIPSTCAQKGQTRFVHVNSETDVCIVLGDKVAVTYDKKLVAIDNKQDYKVGMTIKGKRLLADDKDDIATGDVLELKIEVQQDAFAKSKFTMNNNGFNIEYYSVDASVHQLKFLKILKENSVISTCIFVTFGMILCFFGLKFYKDMLMFFIPLMFVILGFYLYISIVEKSVEINDKLLLILVTILCLGLFIAMAVAFTNIIYIVLCFIKSIIIKL